MRISEAKNFLVQQIAQQAQLEGAPFSDLERRMMYFTETDECPKDSIALNDEFEAKNDSVDYEANISRLLHHAYLRLRKQNDSARRSWDLAIKCLRRGDTI